MSHAQAVCAAKKYYACRKVAKRVARKILGEKGYRLRPYRCRICGAWHLTSAARGT